jgi:N-acetylglucosamine-6-phosphate deacetylase
MEYALVNCRIFTSKRVLTDKAIIIKNRLVKNIVDKANVSNCLKKINLSGMNVAPGFIDLQVNGGGGRLFSDEPTKDCISAIFNAHKFGGTTNFLPTFMSGSEESTLQAIDAVSSVLRDRSFGVLGLHLEGPFINKEKRGVHNNEYVRSISNNELNLLIEKGKGVIKMITLAPELVDHAYIQVIKKSGMAISAGHSDATYEQTMEGFKNGLSSVTHLFNAMSQLCSREPGVIGASFNSENTWASIIVDGLHVDFANVRISKQMKKNRLFLVTDAMPPVGKSMKKFNLGKLKVYCRGNRYVTSDGSLAGSSLNMITAVRNCIKIGIPLDEALRMASTYPAEFLGIDKRFGKIKEGFFANLVIFDNDLHVHGVICYGNIHSLGRYDFQMDS